MTGKRTVVAYIKVISQVVEVLRNSMETPVIYCVHAQNTGVLVILKRC
jgi:hypothetical protein